MRKATLGIDLASQAKKTGVCLIEWSRGGALVTELAVGADDANLSLAISRADKVGIDVPLGWPIAFATAVAGHSTDGTWPSNYIHGDSHAYRYRRTDLAIRTMFPEAPPPLSVSTNLISIPAMRAAALLAASEEACPRDGSGKIVEVYPVAALRRWALVSQSYKGAAMREERRKMVQRIRLQAAWLQLDDDQEELCIRSDDALDALVAALVARASVLNLVEPIPQIDRDAALQEGWIAVPLAASLQQLASGQHAEPGA